MDSNEKAKLKTARKILNNSDYCNSQSCGWCVLYEDCVRGGGKEIYKKIVEDFEKSHKILANTFIRYVLAILFVIASGLALVFIPYYIGILFNLYFKLDIDHFFTWLLGISSSISIFTVGGFIFLCVYFILSFVKENIIDTITDDIILTKKVDNGDLSGSLSESKHIGGEVSVRK